MLVWVRLIPPVSEDVVGMEGLLDPEGVHRPEEIAHLQGAGKRPLLVHIQHDPDAGADGLAHQVGAAHVALGVC